MVYSINGFETKVASLITSQLEWTALSNVFGDTGSTPELSWPLTVLGEEECQVCIHAFGSLYVVCLIHRFINTNSPRCCLCIQFLPFLLSSKGKHASDGLMWYSLPNPSMLTLKCLPGGQMCVPAPAGSSDFVLGACLLSFRQEGNINAFPQEHFTFEYINDRLLYPLYAFRWQVDSKKHLSLKLRCWYKYLKGNSNHSLHWTGALILYTWKRFFKQTLSAQRWHSLSNKSTPKDTFQTQATQHLLSCRKSKRNSEAKNKQNREPMNNRAQFWEPVSENQICFQKTTSIIKH